MVTRQQFVDEARTWLHPKTPFRHQARVKGAKGGVDCIGLVLCTANALGIGFEARKDIKAYSHVPDGKMFIEKAEQYTNKKPYDPSAILAPQVKLGDLLIFWVEDANYPRHISIVSDITNNVVSQIHSFAPLRGVVEVDIDDYWLARIVGVYEIPGLED